MAKGEARAARAEDAAVRVVVERGDLAQTASDLVVVDAYEGVETLGGVTAKVDDATGGLLSRLVATRDFTGKFREASLVYPQQGPAKRVLLVGMGKLEHLTPDRVRRVAAIAARKARDVGVAEVHTSLHGVRDSDKSGLKPRVAGEALTEGALLGLYTFAHYKSRPDPDPKKTKLARVVIVERTARNAAE